MKIVLSFIRTQTVKNVLSTCVSHVLLMKIIDNCGGKLSYSKSTKEISWRKEKYRYFWTMMYHQEVWRDDRSRKLAALARNPKYKNYIWHKCDIMPNCVLKLVRGWHPNPDGIPYMGHLWE